MRRNKVLKKNNNPPAKQTSSNGPSLLGSVANGMAGGFGAGVGIEGARAMIGGITGSSQSNQQQPIQQFEQNKCVFEKEQLEKCMNNGMDCRDFIELLNNCYKAN